MNKLEPITPSSGSEPFTEPLAPLPTTRNDEQIFEEVVAEMDGEELPQVVPTELVEGDPQVPTVREERAPKRWQFWKRRNQREEQIEVLQKGTAEMVGLMRSIRDHLESESEDRSGLNKSLSPLPLAVDNISESNAYTGRMLGELKTTMERSAENDGYLLKSLNRIGDTMTSVDQTFTQMSRTLGDFDKSNQRSVQALKQLGNRVEDSDRFMSETFARLREAEREFTDYVGRVSRRGTFSMVSVCSILLMSILAVGFMFKENRELLSAVQARGVMVVHASGGKTDGIAMAALENPVEDEKGFADADAADAGEGSKADETIRMSTPPERLVSEFSKR